MKLHSTTRGELLVAALALVASLAAGCAGRARMAPFARFGGAPPSGFAAFGPAVRRIAVEPTGAPVVEVDPGPFLGRPVKRADYATKKVAITMDDGPSRNSARVLEIFRAAGIRCTFFYVGDRMGHSQALVKQAYDTGFEIGSHTWHHTEIKGASMAEDLEQIDKGATAIQRITGHRPVFMRPPAGHYDDTGLRAVADSGMIMAMWSLHGQDTGPGTHAATIARNVIRSARGGDIILLHETNPETVRALPEIIRGLKAKGLEPVTLSELLRRG